MQLKKNKNLYGMILGILLAVIGMAGQLNSKEKTISEPGLHELFNTVLYHVKNDYVEEISKQKLWFGAIRGMLKATGDPHTRFMDPDEYNQLTVETKGEFGGLGVEISMKDGYLTVITPIEGTPAMRAGLKPGDQIVEINKKSARNISISDAVKKLRGTPGTSVNLTIARLNQKELVNVDIVREIVKIKVVQSALLKGKDNTNSIGYLKLKQFSSTAAGESIKAIKSFNAKNVKAVILDLRWNPGGLLIASRAIANIFLKDGVVVSTRGRKKNLDKIFYAYPRQNIFKKPLVILVNAGSASASEIVTGAIKDRKRGIIIGKKTYGKGSVQSVIPLVYNTAIALTIQKYYTPSGVSIHKKGIIPDIIVEQPKFTKTDRQNYKLIQEKKYLKTFIKTHKKYNKQSIQQWKSFLKSKKITLSAYALKYLLKKELYYNVKYPIYDLEFDNQLKRAVVELNTKI